jgi:hypothetical protein
MEGANGTYPLPKTTNAIRQLYCSVASSVQQGVSEDKLHLFINVGLDF